MSIDGHLRFLGTMLLTEDFQKSDFIEYFWFYGADEIFLKICGKDLHFLAM